MVAWEDDDWLKRLIGGVREKQQDRARRMGMAFVDLDRHRPDPRADGTMSAELAQELRALPLVKDGGALWVAFAEPNSHAESRIGAATGLRVIPVLCLKGALDRALASL